MQRTKRILLQSTAIALMATGVTACGSSANTPTATPAPTPTPTVAARQEDQFGTAFAADFRAAADSEPASVADGDIAALSLTAEPVNIN